MQRHLIILNMIILSFVLSLFMFGCGSKQKEEFEEKLKTKLTHTPPGEQIGPESATLLITIESNYAITNEMARLIYREITPDDNLDWIELNLQHVADDSFSANIPPQPKGTAWQYYFKITSVTGESITLPKEAPNQTYRLLFKGRVPTFFHVMHIFLSHIVLILIALAGFYAWRILAQKSTIVQCAWFSLIGFIVFILGPLLLGIVVNLYTYGHFWQTVPPDGNGTRLFSLFILIYWLFTLLSVKDVFLRKTTLKTWVREKTFAYLTLINAGFYLFITLFAHRL